MIDFTRRTHVVRISDAKPGEPPSDTYIDVEVLDAVAFQNVRGEEMILNMPQANVAACIKDQTGGGHNKEPGDPTRLSHMKRIVGDDPKQTLDVEVIDVLSFRDARGEEWILDMNSTNGQPSVFNTTDQTGDSRSTRRTHSEKISRNQTGRDPDQDAQELNPPQYVTVERCDSMAFRTALGKELIIKCPSNDDPRSSDPRASTFISSPRGYDPNNPDGPVPPSNKDSNVYVAFVKDADGFLTGKTKIAQGPFWWIRKISAGKAYVYITISARNADGTSVAPPPPKVEFDFGDPKIKPVAKEIDRDEKIVPNTPKRAEINIYFVWSNIAPFPTIDNYDAVVATVPDGGGSVPYAAQFARLISFETGFGPPENFGIPTATVDSSGFFRSFADAEAYANGWPDFPSGAIEEFFNVNLSFGSGAFQRVYPTGLKLPVTPFSYTTLTGHYLIEIPTKETTFEIKITNTASTLNVGTSDLKVEGISDSKKVLKKVDDAAAADKDEGSKIKDSIGSAVYKITTEVIAGPDPQIKKHKVKIKIENDKPIGG